MSSLAIPIIVFACTAVAALIGMFMRAVLPEQHFDEDTRKVVELVMGLIATISAIALGLLIASANNSYTGQETELRQFAVKIIQLDRLLLAYGPEAKDSRALLREGMTQLHDRIWTTDRVALEAVNSGETQSRITRFVAQVEDLAPKTEIQQFARGQALQLALSIMQTRLMMLEATGGAIAWTLLAVLVAWVTVLFLGFGLFSPLRATSVLALLIGAASVAAAVLLILELNTPYAGLVRLSDQPIREALAVIGQPGPQ